MRPFSLGWVSLSDPPLIFSKGVIMEITIQYDDKGFSKSVVINNGDTSTILRHEQAYELMHLLKGYFKEC